METALPIAAEPVVANRAKPRLAFIDNIRWVLIVLVVSIHAAVTYSHVGSWYWMEDPKPGRTVLLIFAGYEFYLQSFFMGLLFFIAGYFVPGALQRKGLAAFLRDRCIRLGAPSLFYMLLIQPVTVYWLLRVFADPGRPPLSRAYLPYITSGRFLSGSGPMWFALALLIFSVVYGIARGFKPVAEPQNSERPLPGNLHVAGLALVMAVCSFLVRTVQPIGTNVLNMQLCFFSQYILLFAFGIRAWRQNWLMRIPYKFGMRWVIAILVAGVPAWLVTVMAALNAHHEDNLMGGWTWQSAALCTWESVSCVGLCLGCIVWFREKWNWEGKLVRWLSDNAFAVYVFHAPLLIAITLAMRGMDAPKLIKFGIATVLGTSLSYAFASLVVRRIPLLNRTF